jgi:hypothetical protein
VRLGIIIPYRNREEHLAQMLPHTVSFFRRNTDIEPLFIVAEQADEHPFNRGAIANHAYAASAGMIDYVCFHDVDYLPMWADYKEPSLPSRIIWHGMDTRPVGHGTDQYVSAQRYGLAAVSVMKKWHFESANGYSNNYWGWGFEDTDLAKRMESVGLPIGYRDGTFIALDHDSNGYDANGESKAAKENEIRFKDRVYPDVLDGLSNLAARVVSIENHMAKGLANGEQAPLLWCKYDLGEMYALSVKSAEQIDVCGGEQSKVSKTTRDSNSNS